MTLNHPVTPPQAVQNLPIRQEKGLFEDIHSYLAQCRSQLHRYPEEEYAQLLHAVAKSTGWPEPGCFIAKSAPEALEFLIEIYIAPGDGVCVSDRHSYGNVIQTQTQIRLGELCTFSTGTLASEKRPKLVFCEGSLSKEQLQHFSELPIVMLNPLPTLDTEILTQPNLITLYTWKNVPASLNPIQPVFGFCPDEVLSATIRKVQEPFHIPTHLLLQMTTTIEAAAQGLATLKLAETPSEALEAGILPEIRSIQPYVPGKGIKVMSRELGMPASAFSKLASNEHPHGISDEMLTTLDNLLKSWQQTPPTYQQVYDRLRAQIIASIQKTVQEPDLNIQQVQLGTGSVELIKAIIKAFVPPGGKVMFPFLPFAMYPYETKKRHAQSLTVPLDENLQVPMAAFIEAIQRDQPHVIFLANPRNPLGTGIADVTPLIEALGPDQVLVLDEAYIDFIRAEMGPSVYPDGVPLLQRYPDKKIISLRTFSKGHALASFRIGFSICRPDLSEAISSVLLPCQIDPLTLAAAIASLETPGIEEQIQELVSHVISEKQRMYQFLSELGLRYVRSYGNFIYFETGKQHTAKSLFDHLARQGVIIRPVQERAVRMNIGSPKEDEHFITAMRQAYQS